ncbi:MAG: tRNA preQ1(34) S-adenosylmethionine ribosyltransferase-isomerase QueA [Clostridiales Family XIII bacterium]|jgi:S-adenosylmethionine:tRNA ribosyltransferase-isomerase|nr:tRNA preQ1(34) S-adenosylmethionine ribosyltransferase-isomerase QueA [Clostridiales Family XIII bacterium]
MFLSDFDYYLPEGQIARYPAEKRDESRLMALHMGSGALEHRRFYEITEYLRPGDCLVINDSKVMKARLRGFKESGAAVELLLFRRGADDVWEAMVRPGKKLRPGDTVYFRRGGAARDDEGGAREEVGSECSAAADWLGRDEFSADVLDYGSESGTRLLRFRHCDDFMGWLDILGEMPIPPYMRRKAESIDDVRYQTVYSREWGSVAAPTAGLHFTEELLRVVGEAGVAIARVTLHVGPGTFLPVKAERVEEHRMHFEEYRVSEESAETVNSRKAEGGRVICVGTTATRTLESAAFLPEEGAGPVAVAPKAAWRLRAGRGVTDIFIRPGHDFKMTDGLITNFHLPKSTLLMLVAALCGRERALAAYKEAVAEGYRFFSYGDAMLIVE